MIYSRDVAHLGGTVSNAAQAVENMVDVSVDKVNHFLSRHHLIFNIQISHNESLHRVLRLYRVFFNIHGMS